MKQKTIAELRRTETIKLAARLNDGLSDESIRKANRAMNSFYRTAAFSIRVFEFDNDGNRYNPKASARLEKELERRTARTNSYLKEFGACMSWAGLYADVVKSEDRKTGKHVNVIETYYY